MTNVEMRALLLALGMTLGAESAPAQDPCTQVPVTALSGLPGGACWDGTHLWVAEFFTRKLMRIDLASGEIVSEIEAPGPYVGGLAWDGSTLWVAPEQHATLYQLDPTTGAVLHSVPTPGAGSQDPNGAGLAWDGTALWHADYGFRMIYRIDPSDGAVLEQFAAPATQPAGLAWRNDQLVLANPGSDEILRLDATTGEVLGSCPALPGQAMGVAVDSDTRALVTTWNPSEVVEIAMDLAPPGPPVFWETLCDGRVNSLGAPATLSAEGSPSITSNDLTLVAAPVPNGFGLLLLSPHQGSRQLPFGELCVGRPRVVGAVARSAEQQWRAPVDLSRQRCRGSWAHAGESWTFQVFYRDPSLRPRFALSGAVSITFEE